MGQLENLHVSQRPNTKITEESAKITEESLRKILNEMAAARKKSRRPGAYDAEYKLLIHKFSEMFGGLNTRDKCMKAINIAIGLHTYPSLGDIGEDLFEHATMDIENSQFGRAQTTDEKIFLAIELSRAFRLVFDCFDTMYKLGENDVYIIYGEYAETYAEEAARGMKKLFDSIKEVHFILKERFGIRIRRDIKNGPVFG